MSAVAAPGTGPASSRLPRRASRADSGGGRHRTCTQESGWAHVSGTRGSRMPSPALVRARASPALPHGRPWLAARELGPRKWPAAPFPQLSRPGPPGPRAVHLCSRARMHTRSHRSCPGTCPSRRGCWRSHPSSSHSWVLVAGGAAVSSGAPPPRPPPQARPGTCGPLEAGAEVGIVAVLAGAAVAAGLAVALVNIALAVVACVARPAQAGEGGHPVLAHPVVARVGVTLVDVHLAVRPRVACRAGPGASGRLLPESRQPDLALSSPQRGGLERASPHGMPPPTGPHTFCAHTGVCVGPVQALGAILAGCAGTLVHVILTQMPGETCGQGRAAVTSTGAGSPRLSPGWTRAGCSWLGRPPDLSSCPLSAPAPARGALSPNDPGCYGHNRAGL